MKTKEDENIIIDDDGCVFKIPKTICMKCKYYINLEPTSPRSKCDYNKLCKANPLKKVIDPIDGELKYTATNDIGGIIFKDKGDAYEACRKFNDGNCFQFESK